MKFILKRPDYPEYYEKESNGYPAWVGNKDYAKRITIDNLIQEIKFCQQTTKDITILYENLT